MPHTSAAVASGQELAAFFVNESRRNDRSFSYASALPLIYNFTPTFTAPRGSSYEQVYYFDL